MGEESGLRSSNNIGDSELGCRVLFESFHLFGVNDI